MRNILIGIILLLALAAVLTWSPWLDEHKIKEDVYNDRAVVDGTAAAGCDYKVQRMFLGRWVVSCEAGYFIPFWGGRI